MSNITTEAVTDDLEAVLRAGPALEAVPIPEVALEAVTAHTQILARARHILNRQMIVQDVFVELFMNISISPDMAGSVTRLRCEEA